MKDCWPDPQEPDALFGAAVLAFGPVPRNGWSKARDDDGTVVYTSVRGKAARAFTGNILAFLKDAVDEQYEYTDWTDTHRERIARRWKNQFFRWLWEQLDDSGTEDNLSPRHERGKFADVLSGGEVPSRVVGESGRSGRQGQCGTVR